MMLAGVAVAASMLSGCGRSTPPSGAKPAATAEEALRGFLQGMKDLDERAMLARCKVSDEESAALCTLMEFGRAAQDFRAAFIEAYGKEAWERFNDPDYSPGETNAHVTLLEEPVEDMVAASNLQMQGDAVATFVMPNESRLSRIVKTDKGWLIDAHTLFPAEIEPEKFMKVMREMGNHLRKYKKAIGQTGITADDIDVELGRAFTESLFGLKLPTPHRFDIDKL